MLKGNESLMAHKRLGDLLIDAGLITEDQLVSALKSQRDSHRRLGDELIAKGVITETELIEALCQQLGIDYIDLTNVILPAELTQVVPKNLARKYDMVPVRATRDEVFIAMSDPMNFIAQEEARVASRRRVIPMISHHTAIERAIMQLYGNEGAARAIEEMRSEQLASGSDASASPVSSSTIGGEDEAQSAPTIRLVNSIIERATTERASDIHLEPREGDLQVRMRVDGIMRNVLTVPRDLQGAVISRLKIMGGMNIAEHRLPQDGRANVRLKSKDIDLRLSTLPTIYGESVVVRLLDKSAALLSPAGIGLSGANYEKYERLINSTNGVILITGPTGSGKSSTMYTMIRERRRPLARHRCRAVSHRLRLARRHRPASGAHHLPQLPCGVHARRAPAGLGWHEARRHDLLPRRRMHRVRPHGLPRSHRRVRVPQRRRRDAPRD